MTSQTSWGGVLALVLTGFLALSKIPKCLCLSLLICKVGAVIDPALWSFSRV